MVNSPENKRSELRGDIQKDPTPCQLQDILDPKKTIDIRPVDVSPRGLGFFSKTEIDAGRIYYLLAGSYKLKVEVAYAANHLGIEDMYRCGLFLREPSDNLTDIFNELEIGV